MGQAPAGLEGSDARLGWLQDVLPEVAEQGADLLLLPELFACGYHIGKEVTRRAEPIEGPAAAEVERLARRHGQAICYGFAERAGDQNFNAALCIGPDGNVLGHHRKLAIPPGFERSYFTPGRGCQVFGYRGFKIAILICYDAEFPETVRHAATEQAEVILVPTALGAEWTWVSERMIPARAYENGVYLAYANSAGAENGMAFLGNSVVATPDGGEAARAGAEPGLIFADLRKDCVAAAQTRLPYLNDRTSINLR